MRTIQAIPFTMLHEIDQDVESSCPALSAIPIHRIVAHEVRNYLTILVEGIANLRARAPIDALSSITSLERASQQITHLIPLLQFETSEARKEAVDIVCLLWEQLDLMESLFRSQSVHLFTDIPNDPILAVCDSNQLGSALLNLIKNAIDACAENDTVSISCHASISQVTIIIQDTGIGMTPEQLSRLWEPLFTTKPNGMGLGTCIAWQIIVNHGGSIRAESTPAVGTTITIELPVSKPLS